MSLLLSSVSAAYEEQVTREGIVTGSTNFKDSRFQSIIFFTCNYDVYCWKAVSEAFVMAVVSCICCVSPCHVK